MIETNRLIIMANEVTVDYTKFDVKYLSFTKLEENSRSKGQMIAYPRYDSTNSGKDGPLFIQTPWIKLYTYGVPKLGEYYKTDADRAHLRVPLDLSIPEVAEFAEKMKSIDAYLGSAEQMEAMIGKKAKKYKYNPIYREGQDSNNDDDSDDEKEKKKDTPPRPPYMKIKLDTTWPDNNIKTQVFNSVLNKETGKRVRTKVENINTVDDFANAVRFLSNVRLMFRPVKYWAHNASKKDPECGVVFKLIKVEVEPNPSSNSMYKQIYENDNFIDSDGGDEPLPQKLVQPETVFKTPSKQTKEESDSDESGDDEEKETKPSKQPVDEDDSESSDDEVLVQKTQQVATVESDSDESESSEEPVKKGGKGGKKVPAKETSKTNSRKK